MRTVRRLVTVIVGVVVFARLFLSVLPIWKIRYYGIQIAARIPNELLPTSFTVLPPPDTEYFGVWDVPAEEARRRLVETYGFNQMVRAYLHAYEYSGRLRCEVASCSYRPDGRFGKWQLHVRLFPTDDGKTELWCHWERNPNRSPIQHLRQDGYDPEEGKRRLRSLLDEPLSDVDAPQE